VDQLFYASCFYDSSIANSVTISANLGKGPCVGDPASTIFTIFKITKKGQAYNTLEGVAVLIL
jgi:hypothetical protein